LKDIDAENSFFADHPLLMMSQSANDLCISILLHSDDAEDLLRVLHARLISERLDTAYAQEVFGLGWQEIQG
jgi:hypothetical protein